MLNHNFIYSTIKICIPFVLPFRPLRFDKLTSGALSSCSLKYHSTALGYTQTKRERESWSLGLESKAIKSKPIKSSDYKTIFKTIFF